MNCRRLPCSHRSLHSLHDHSSAQRFHFISNRTLNQKSMGIEITPRFLLHFVAWVFIGWIWDKQLQLGARLYFAITIFWLIYAFGFEKRDPSKPSAYAMFNGGKRILGDSSPGEIDDQIRGTVPTSSASANDQSQQRPSEWRPTVLSRAPSTQPQRAERCECGSGKLFKYCCSPNASLNLKAMQACAFTADGSLN